ncbi:MAG TPA: hypothetical protein VH186_12860 [Chloroflexia bacterium]|nr:hypothetical protein [Chloroflexia bacterium]
MNRYMQEQWPMVEGTQGMRIELLDSLSDSDLQFSPGGQNMTLGELCRESGEVDYSYIQSFKNYKQDWSYHNTEEGLASSVSRLKEWYQALDKEFKEVVSAMEDEDFKKTIDRDGFQMPVEYQFQAYIQALLIFFGKATIYLRAMNKPLPPKIKDWIW